MKRKKGEGLNSGRPNVKREKIDGENQGYSEGRGKERSEDMSRI